MPGLLLKEDAEALAKIFRVAVDDASEPSTPRGETSPDAFVHLSELAEELSAEADTVDPVARWQDVGTRRSLFDRALVGRLSCTRAPAVDYLIRCFTRCGELRSRKRDVSSTNDEVFTYISELCVSYTSIALLNPSMFPQPPEVEAEGVVRLVRHLKVQGSLQLYSKKLGDATRCRIQQSATHASRFAESLAERDCLAAPEIIQVQQHIAAVSDAVYAGMELLENPSR